MLPMAVTSPQKKGDNYEQNQGNCKTHIPGADGV